MAYDLNYDTASIEQLVDFCRTSTHRALPGSPHVIRLSQTTVVKFGTEVRKEEADNQSVAFRLLNPHIVRVPRVLGFHTRQTQYGTQEGYLIMEYIDGQVPNSDSYIELTAALIPILQQFETIQSLTPGALSGGPARGIFWDDDFPQFSSRVDFDAWINRRLTNEEALALENTPLSICHMDLAPRNILKLPDSSICLLDWANAGFYPQVFEAAMLQLQPAVEEERTFYEGLSKAMVADAAQLSTPTNISNRPPPLVQITRCKRKKKRSKSHAATVRKSALNWSKAAVEALQGIA
ncbi:hypothetical protein FKW77_001941 [Venturia effusa]|uniref:Aminoglycoside phosphotransferase domain-containing protein n=1 Tax=Venturia effusa TaxID=50376 RepID=A0A517LQU4_9PEZI|nr:hypothetical protein FKW77_001941 [Venturia effusa]